MAIALGMAHEHGGKLVRYIGGFWSYEKAPRGHDGNPIDHVGTSTVESLVKRGRLRYSEWKQGAHFKFPVVAELIDLDGGPS